MVNDLRHGLRVLAKRPGPSLLALLVIAITTSGLTSVFALVNAALLRPIPYMPADRWGYVVETSVAAGLNEVSVSLPNFRDWRAQARSFEGMYLWQPWTFNASGLAGVDPERVDAAIVTGELFEAMNVRPVLGRMLRPGEEPELPARHIVISHSLWKRRFAGDPNMAGRQIQLNLVPFTVVGVAPEGFKFPPESNVEIWVPYGERDILGGKDRGARGFSVAAKLREGVTFARAQAELNTIAQRLAAQYPEDKGFGVRLTPVRAELAGRLREPLLLTFAALALVLILACINVANIQMVRNESRAKEFGVRLALGSGPARLARQILAETLLLAAGGAGLGLLAAPALVGWMVAAVPTWEIRWLIVEADWRVASVATAIVFITTALAGFIPAWRASRTTIRAALATGGSSTSGSSALSRWGRRGFLVAQVAFSLVPLLGAGLLVQSFIRLQQRRPGFAPEQRVSLSFMAPRLRYGNPEGIVRLAEQVQAEVSSTPGVKAVGLGQAVPFGRGGMVWFGAASSRDPGTVDDLARLPHVLYNMVTPGFLAALGIPLRAGRDIGTEDSARAQPVVLINEALARRYFPKENPLGKMLWVGHAPALRQTPARRVIGVIGDALWLNAAGDLEPAVWVPLAQQSTGVDGFRSLYLVVHSVGHESMLGEIRERIRKVDPDLPLTNIYSMQARLGEAMWRYRLAASAMGALGSLAALIAVFGVFAVVGFLVKRREHEMGIRLALGSTPSALVRLVLAEGLWLILAGLALGGLGGYAGSRYLESMLFGVTATDVTTFATATVGLALAAILACYIPARRAASVDPSTLFR